MEKFNIVMKNTIRIVTAVFTAPIGWGILFARAAGENKDGVTKTQQIPINIAGHKFNIITRLIASFSESPAAAIQPILNASAVKTVPANWNMEPLELGHDTALRLKMLCIWKKSIV
jgi:hypothetical protein